MAKWHWPDELEPPVRYNLLVAFTDGAVRVCRRLGIERVYAVQEVDSKNRLVPETSRPHTDIFCWTTCPYVPHAKTPVTKFGQAKLEKKKENQRKFAEMKREKASGNEPK